MAKVNANASVETDSGLHPVTNKPTRVIYLRAEGIRAFGGGFFAIEVPAERLSPDEYRMLDQLFPNTQPRVEELLSTEALISAQDKPMPDVELKVNSVIDRDGYSKPKY